MALKSPEKEQDLSKAVYAEYQKNATTAMTLQAQVLTGLKTGRPLAELLLLALEALSKLTHEDTALKQAEADLSAVYGYVLEEPGSVELEIRKLEERMEKMNEALKADDVPDSDKRVLEASILAHQKAIRRLQNG